MTGRRRRLGEDAYPLSTPVTALPCGGVRYDLPIALHGEIGTLVITVRDGEEPRVTLTRRLLGLGTSQRDRR